MRNRVLAGSVLMATLTACGGGGGGHAALGKSGGTGGSGGRGTPVQLTVDPCTLVTQPEAEKVLGLPVAKGGPGINGNQVCTYVANGAGGVISVSAEPPTFCKLLFLALDKNLFGGKQVRVDDIGDGGMQVTGNGNVQFTTHGGCIEVSGLTATGHVDDAAMIEMAKTAASRVTG